MNWYYAENNEQRGPLSETEFLQLVNEGKITPDTLVWCQGMDGWKPYGEVEPKPSAPVMPVVGVAPLEFVEAPIEPTGPPGLPWENRSNFGFFGAIFETVKLVLSDPSAAFTRMKRDGGLAEPLLYSLIVGSVCSYVALVYQLIATAVQGFPQVKEVGKELTVQYIHFPHSVLVLQFGFGILVMPVMIVIGIFVLSLMLHVILFLLGGARQSFETTFRVVCYSTGSTAIWQLLPICGFYIGLVWNVVATCIGLAKAHEISTGKAVVTVLLPAILCCGAGIFAVGFLFWMITTSAGAHR